MTVADPFSMDGRVVLVTGARRGLGRALALGFGRAGADVAVNYISQEDGARDLARQIEETTGRRAVAVRADVTDAEQVREMVTTVGEVLGPADTLICCAGLPGNRIPTLELDLDDWHRVLRVHLDGTLLCAREVVRQHMAPRRSGSIVALASIAGFNVIRAAGPSTAYRTAKGGLLMLTRNLALEWVGLGIRVNSICPGFFATDSLGDGFGPGNPAYETAIRDIPMARIADPDELVGPAVFLASAASSYVTGTALTVDGGYTSW